MNKMLKKHLKRIILILLYKITKPIDILFLFLFDINICDKDKCKEYSPLQEQG